MAKTIDKSVKKDNDEAVDSPPVPFDDDNSIKNDKKEKSYGQTFLKNNSKSNDLKNWPDTDAGKSSKLEDASPHDDMREFNAFIESTIDVLKRDKSPFVLGLLLAEAKTRYGKSCLTILSKETKRPYKTLAQQAQFANELKSLEKAIIGTPLEWHSRCLISLAKSHKSDPDKVAKAIEIITDEKQPQNTAESALKFLDIEKNADVKIDIEFDRDAAEEATYKMIGQQQGANPLQKIISDFICLDLQAKEAFCVWLDDYLPKTDIQVGE